MNKLSIYQTAYMKYPYTLPPLAYACDALEPHIDAQTMRLHHDKHHQAYIDHANEAVGKYPELQKTDLVTLLAHLDELPAVIRGPLQGNGGSGEPTTVAGRGPRRITLPTGERRNTSRHHGRSDFPSMISVTLRSCA